MIVFDILLKIKMKNIKLPSQRKSIKTKKKVK